MKPRWWSWPDAMRLARVTLVAKASWLAVMPIAALAQAPGSTGEMMDNARRMTALSTCPGQPISTGGDSIIVCATKDKRERYRLPFRGEGSGPAALIRGETPRASAEVHSTAPCGIFEGQRRCRKAEALYYGYGGGRDPLSAIAGLGTLLLDGDADVAPPPALPRAAATKP